MNIKYTGALKDYSGYGEAGRHDVLSLLSAGVGITAEIPKYTMELTDFGVMGNKCVECENLPLDYQIKILHVTPNVYPQYYEKGKYHIGRVIWETDKLPEDFAKGAELCDEIWTASEFNKKAIEKAGVTKPIYIIPEAIVENPEFVAIAPYTVENKTDYKFYSMFEWTERKNPLALLEIFWREFENVDGVSLTIKTYVDNFRPEKQKEIYDMIQGLKSRMGLKKYAKVFLVMKLMDRHQIYRFHKTFDCFVSAHRGEGWGIPQMEAMYMGKPIISTNCGGVHDHLTHEVAHLIDYKLVPLQGNTRNRQWYGTDQNWAEVDTDSFRKSMREVYENQKEAKEMGKKAHNFVLKHFETKVVGKLMSDRLLQIEKNL